MKHAIDSSSNEEKGSFTLYGSIIGIRKKNSFVLLQGKTI